MRRYLKLLLSGLAILFFTVNLVKAEQPEDLIEKIVIGRKNQDRNAVQEAKENLIALGNRAIPAIEEYLTHEQKAIRSALIHLLGRINTEKSTRLLIKVFCNSGDESMRYSATNWLEERPMPFGVGEETLECLKKEIALSEDWRMRSRAARILAKIEGIDVDVRVNPIVEALEKEIQKPTSQKMLQESYMTITESIKRQYILALRDIGEQAIPYIKAALTESTSLKERQYLVIALGFLKDEDMFSELSEMMLSAEAGYIRSGAATALGYIGNEEAIPFLLEAIHDPFVVPRVLDLIVPGLDNSIEYPVRTNAGTALRQLGVKVHSFEHEQYVIDERFDNYLEQKELLEKAGKEYEERRDKILEEERQQKGISLPQGEPTTIALPSLTPRQER